MTRTYGFDTERAEKLRRTGIARYKAAGKLGTSVTQYDRWLREQHGDRDAAISDPAYWIARGWDWLVAVSMARMASAKNFSRGGATQPWRAMERYDDEADGS
jgi:hypothetical protein